jgi:hypothetical protein
VETFIFYAMIQNHLLRASQDYFMIFNGLPGTQLEVALKDLQDLDEVMDIFWPVLVLIAGDCNSPLFIINRWQ